MILMLLFACALSAHRTGLVSVADGVARLQESTGRASTLVTRGEGSALLFLDGCIVSVSGPRLGRRLTVTDWEVTDAGDGVAPFVGPLRRYGMQWIIDDRNTGMPVLLEEASLAGLEAEVGHLVLVSGYVVGAQTVRVVAWRALEAPAQQ